jgi:hypothetical protein
LIKERLLEFIKCAFKQYDGSSSSIESCRVAGGVRASLAGWIIMCASGQSWMISLIFFGTSDQLRVFFNTMLGRAYSRIEGSTYATVDRGQL